MKLIIDNRENIKDLFNFICKKLIDEKIEGVSKPLLLEKNQANTNRCCYK